jgi:hypothetical protein
MVIQFAAPDAPSRPAAVKERGLAAPMQKAPRISARKVGRRESPTRAARIVREPRGARQGARVGSLTVFSLPAKAFKVYRPAA